VHCSVLQCVAVYCSVLQCVAVRCSVLQCVAVCCSVLQCVTVCLKSRYNKHTTCVGCMCARTPHAKTTILQCVAVCGVARVAVCCSVFPIKIHYMLYLRTTLQHTATHCNTMQHIATQTLPKHHQRALRPPPLPSTR